MRRTFNRDRWTITIAGKTWTQWEWSFALHSHDTFPRSGRTWVYWIKRGSAAKRGRTRAEWDADWREWRLAEVTA